MNISRVISELRLANGLQTIALPFKQSTEVVLHRILKMSIHTFSHFHPFEKEGFCEMKNLVSPDEVSKKRGIFILPAELTTSPVHEAYATPISDDYANEQLTTAAFTVGSPFIGFGAYYPQDIINATHTAAAINKYAGITSRAPTSEWLGFNKIRLVEFPTNCWVHFTVKCDHDENGETIEESCVESFKQLANLDIQRTLYSNIKNINGLGGVFKDIQIKIEEWSGAQAAYDALLEKWEGRFHLDMLDLVEFF